MKGKKIFKRIVVSMLTLAIMCSNIPVSAGSLPKEEIPAVTEADPMSEADPAPETETAPDSDPAEAPAEPAPAETLDGGPEDDAAPEDGTLPDTDAPSADDADETDPQPEKPEEPKEEDPAADPDQTPAEEVTPGRTDAVQQPEETEMPAEQEEPEEEAPEYVEDEPLDFEDQISIEDMSVLPDAEGVAATIWSMRAANSMLTALYGVDSDETEETKAWTFDAYYVNQTDPYHVVKTNNFDLKYQMEFHASQDLVKGAVLIRIPLEIYRDRNGNPVLPTEIAVPQGTLDSPVQNRTTPFNYYIEGNDGETQYLVFFNYRKITSGTNAAWQVLYKNQKLMNIVDETPWELTPQISVDTGAKAPTEDKPEGIPAEPYDKREFDDRTALTGKVDSSVSLSTVTKTPYYEQGKNYGPGLYTVNQVEKYINGNVPERYLNTENRLDTKKWSFTVWDVKITGTATQPWNLVVQDIPMLSGDSQGAQVVGYKDNSSSSTSYRLAVNAPDASVGGEDGFADQETFLENRTDESWGNRFYVVTAYPAERVSEGTVLQNKIMVALEPRDGFDVASVKESAPSTWIYEDYDWHFSGDKIGIEKKNGIGSGKDDTTVYTGWLDAYRRSREQETDYGEIPYSTSSVMHGYSDTHRTNSGTDDGESYTTGDYIPGTYYTFTTADDFLYLYTDTEEGKKGLLLDGNDYYFSDITVTQTDYGYDVWEDETRQSELGSIAFDQPEQLPEGVFTDEDGTLLGSEVRIYAMLADPADQHEPDEWVQIYSGRMDPDRGSFTATLADIERQKPGLIDQKPYRIKVEHDSIDFESDCRIEVKVRLRADSLKMKEVVNAHADVSRTDGESPVIRLENLSGAVCRAYRKTDGDLVETSEPYCYRGDEIDQNYKAPGLKEETNTLYPGLNDPEVGIKYLPVRDNAVRNLTWLTETAEANKESSTTNDVNNNRVLVDYYLTAYDGYEIYDRSVLDYLNEDDQELISPGRTHVVFYDLLPYGMQYDASTAPMAGRITELDQKGYYKTRPGNWSKTQVEVVVDPSRDITPDYRGTGRTMVAFHVIYTGADATSYTAQKWIEGWGVTFRAYYDWKDIDQINDVEINSNLCAFMPDFSEIAGGSNDDHPSLCGLKSEVDYDDGTHGDGDVRPDVEAAYEDMVRPAAEGGARGNIDGISALTKADGTVEDGIDTKYRNVIYAKNALKSVVATSSTSRLETLVHADADRLGTYGPVATVPVTGNPPEGSLLNLYTYDNTVTVDTDTKGLVIFDRLETAANDRGAEDPFYPFEKNPWSGTFRGVDVSGLEKQGYHVTVYYHTDEEAPVASGDQDPAEILTSEKQWYTEAQMKEEFGDEWQRAVRAIAVDLRYGADQTEQTIPGNNSVSFRIKMTAPTPEDGKSIYTYNNASFSSVSVKTNTRAAVTGNSVRVAIGEPETLEIIKKTSGQVPSALKDERFEFHIYEEYLYNKETTRRDLAFTEYKLYKLNSDGGWEEQTAQTHATDGSGYFYLHADEKAVFELADTGHLKVDETPNVFWESRVDEKRTKTVDGRRIGASDGDTVTRTVTNVYRPVLYAQKSISSVPAGVELSEADRTFTFRLQTVGRDAKLHPVADAEYWIVDSVRLDGGIPAKLDSGRTDADGRFMIKEGQIIALFPGVAGTQYELSEVIPEDTADSRWNWHCENSTLTGKLPAAGDSRTITNYYRWKDLLLKKEITHQSKEDYEKLNQPFTFRLLEPELDDKGEPKVDADGNYVVLTKADGKTYTTEGLKWVLLNEDGTEPAQPGAGGAETPDPSEEGMPDEEISGGDASEQTSGGTGQEGENSGTAAEASAVSGTLDKEGTFTCVAGYRTVKIRGLEAGKTYILQELTDEIGTDSVSSKPLYVPNNDTVELTMPIYSSKKDVTVTNDYQMRPLSVTKTVAKAGGDTSRTESGTSETVQTYGFRITVRRTKADGSMTEVFPAAGTKYLVTRPGAEDEERAIGEDGTFRLADGETAVFKDIGMLGDQYVVDEIDDEDQIYPPRKDGEAGVAEGILSGDGNEEKFVNGAPGSLMISKIYLGMDESGADLVQKWEQDLEDTYAGPALPDGRISFVLNAAVDGTPYGGMIHATLINQKTGKTIDPDYLIIPGEPAELTAGQIVVIQTGEGEGCLPSDVVYTVEETEECRHRILKWEEPKREVYWMQIDQNSASEELMEEKPVAERPMAVIYNEVKRLPDFEGSEIEKQMTSVSNPVPEGAKLVWRVEEYDAGIGRWIPKDGVPYAIFAQGMKKSGGIRIGIRPGMSVLYKEPVSGQIETTRDGGKIYLTSFEKTDELGNRMTPIVCFQSDQVYVNLYKQSDIDELLKEVSDGKSLLRVVEVPEESDEAWGQLAGYLKRQAAQGVLPQGSERKASRAGDDGAGLAVSEKYSYSMDTSPKYAAGFMNSNAKDTFEIAKKTPDNAEMSFTMIVKQVLSVEYVRDDDTKEITDTKVVAATLASGIPYTLIRADGSTAKGTTGLDGSVRLYAGDRAVLEVREGTMWTVSELTSASPTYRLASMEREQNPDRLTELNENLMLVNVPMSQKYTLVFDDNGGTGGPGTLAQVFKEAPEGGVMFTIPDMEPTREGYKFLGWSEGSGDYAIARWEAGMEYKLEDGVTSKTLYASWKKQLALTLIVQDPKTGETFHQSTNFYSKDSEVTLMEMQQVPKGYKLLGWSATEDGDTVDYAQGESFEITEDTTLYAVLSPKAPEKTDIYGILKNFVTVECVADGSKHDPKNYCTGGENADITISEVSYLDGKYRCELTLNGDAYVGYYGLAQQFGVGVKHILAPGEAKTKTLTLVWNTAESKWKADTVNSVIFKATCEVTVRYTDGVEGERVFPDHVYVAELGSSTPSFGEDPTREGYNFMGWNPSVNPTVAQDDISPEYGEIIYTATWQSAE